MKQYEERQLSHYDHLIIKGLMNKGGSSSETYVYKLLTGDIEKGNKSITDMWNYLDPDLQTKLIIIFHETDTLDLFDMSDDQIIEAITNHIAKRQGWNVFRSMSERELNALSDEEYDQQWEVATKAAKEMLLANG